MFRHLYDHFREFLDRHGLAFGAPTLGGSVALDIQSHGSWLSALGIVVGIICTVGHFLIRLVEFFDRLRTNRVIRLAASRPDLQAARHDRLDPETSVRAAEGEGRGQAILRLAEMAEASGTEAPRKPVV